MITVIPAQPGWRLLHTGIYEGNDDPFDARDLEEIIAWRIETAETRDGCSHFETVTPITAMGSIESAWVVSPFSAVSDGHSYTFRSIEDAIANIRKGEA